MSNPELQLPDNSFREQLQDVKKHNVSVFYHHHPDIELVEHVSNAINRAVQHDSNIHPDIVNPYIVNGFTGLSFRHLLNNIADYEGINYLEIGTFCGSSLLSVLYNNLDKISSVYAMDNWSEFDKYVNPKQIFEMQMERYAPDTQGKLNFYEEDCFSFDKSKIKHKINLYFYDGHHSREEQEMAFTYFNDVLDDTFVAIIDDWEQGPVRDGTLAAFDKLNYEILASWQIVPPARENKTENPDLYWWLGNFIAVIRKTKNGNEKTD